MYANEAIYHAHLFPVIEESVVEEVAHLLKFDAAKKPNYGFSADQVRELERGCGRRIARIALRRAGFNFDPSSDGWARDPWMDTVPLAMPDRGELEAIIHALDPLDVLGPTIVRPEDED